MIGKSRYVSVIVNRVTEDGGKVNFTTLPETVAVAFLVVTAFGCSKVLWSCTSSPPRTSASADAALPSPPSMICEGRDSVRWGFTTVGEWGEWGTLLICAIFLYSQRVNDTLRLDCTPKLRHAGRQLIGDTSACFGFVYL